MVMRSRDEQTETSLCKFITYVFRHAERRRVLAHLVEVQGLRPQLCFSGVESRSGEQFAQIVEASSVDFSDGGSRIRFKACEFAHRHIMTGIVGVGREINH